MASCRYSHVTCVRAFEDAFYFQEVAADTDVDEDRFDITPRPCPHYWVQSQDSNYLLLNKQEFQVQDLTCEELDQSDCKFAFQSYCNFGEAREGNPTMLYANCEGKKVVACCDLNHNVISEKMDALPRNIEESRHKALFYMTKLSPCNMYQFESSLFPNEFLGFAPDGENPGLKKLVLIKHQVGRDEVVNSCHVLLYK